MFSEVRSWPTWGKWAAGVLVAVIVLGILGGALGDEDERKTERVASTVDSDNDAVAVEEEPEPHPVRLDIRRPSDGSTVKGQTVTEIVVKSRDNATVTINDGPTRELGNGRFAKRVPLHLGNNSFEIEASAPGFEATDDRVLVVRERSAAELAALRQAQAERRAREEAEYRAGATSIDYDQLAKNADRYRGERVTYRGQIFQIGEDYGSTWMLLSVTDMGYGFWDDNIYVTYDGTIQGAEDDIVTIYGTVKGDFSYETQIGGETYVPKVKARYIDE